MLASVREWHFHARRLLEAGAFGWNCAVRIRVSGRKCTKREPGKDHHIRRSGKLLSCHNVQAKLISNLATFQQRMLEKKLRANPPYVTLDNFELTFKPFSLRASAQGKRRKDLRKRLPSFFSIGGVKK
jgi:hypothetical protein